MFILKILLLSLFVNALPVQMTIYKLEHPWLCLFDLRIFSTFAALSVILLLCFKSQGKFIRKNQNSLKRCIQGVLLSKYIILMFCFFLYPQFLVKLSNTVEFTRTLYMILAVFDICSLLCFVYLVDHSIDFQFNWGSVIFFIVYYTLYNCFCSFNIDIYRYQVDFRDSSILCFFSILLSSFYSGVVCPEISRLLN